MRVRPGVASVLLTLSKQLGGRRKVLLTLARAARPKGKGMIDKKGETRVSPFLPAVRPRRPRICSLG